MLSSVSSGQSKAVEGAKSNSDYTRKADPGWRDATKLAKGFSAPLLNSAVSNTRKSSEHCALP
ncbi:hypothetical protein GCM10007933_00170 [Zoogloea oryzae]|uniref:Uncharacterized protein n=1 Tax=Zoogloea oryzae TaxID=310767 RepID=A0ABQ6F6Y3_9RHOO|nr:hypothetical protein GCM10007933_00170 [Zoogloea oryzae]